MENKGVMHKYIAENLYLKFKNNEVETIINRHDVKIFLGWHNIPKQLQNKFLEEMRSYGLIEIKNKQKVKLIPYVPSDNPKV